MKKILNLTTLILMGAAVLTSCSVKDGINERKKNIPVRFTAGVADQTAVPKSRAAGTQWAAGDAVGIFMLNGGAELASNKQYEVQTAGTTADFEAVPGDEIYYPQENAVDFIAYYPYDGVATLGTPVDITIETTQTTANQPLFDLLYSDNASGVAKSENAVELKFEHKLSRLEMIILSGDGIIPADFTGMSVTIKGMNTKTTFDLTDGSLGTPQTRADIIPVRNSSDSYHAIILPSEAITNDGDYSVDFTIYPGTTRAETFTWKMAAGTEFKGGYEYICEVRIARTGVTATGTIRPWITFHMPDVTAQ